MLRNSRFRQKLEMMENICNHCQSFALIHIIVIYQRLLSLPDSFHRIILRVRVLLVTPHPGVYEGESDNG